MAFQVTVFWTMKSNDSGKTENKNEPQLFQLKGSAYLAESRSPLELREQI